MKKITTILFLQLFIVVAHSQNDLPDWFYNPPKSTDNYFYSIGISDPGLNKKDALLQAENRAILSFTLMHTVDWNKTFYSITRILDSTYSDALLRTRINVKYPYLYFETINKDFSSNNEAIVLLKVTFYDLKGEIGLDSISINLKSDIYSTRTDSTSTWEFESLSHSTYKSKVKNSTTDDYLNAKIEKGKNYNRQEFHSKFDHCPNMKNAECKYDDNTLDKSVSKTTVLTDDYNYQIPKKQNKTSYNSLFPNQIQYTTTFKKGLWFAYFNSLMYEFSECHEILKKGITQENIPYHKVIIALKEIELKSDSLTLRLNYTDPMDKEFYAYSEYENVDKNIPKQNNTYPYRFALIIGNEDYSSFQTDLKSEVNVDYASNDANIFKEYAHFTLGIPEDNIVLLTNAKAIEMDRAINKLNLLIKNSNGKADVFFYYAGHGLPDETTKEAYIIPCDVSGSDLKYAFKLNDLYSKLTEYPSKRVTFFLDACFSGGSRNQGLIAARGVKVKPKGSILKGNIIVYSASTGEQSAMPYSKKKHGLFTYFLLKKLQISKGEINYNALSEYLNEEVGINSLKINNKEQNSQTLSSPEITENWKDWELIY